MWRPFSCSSHRIHFKCRYPATLCQIASNPIVASLKLLARRGLTTRSTGHFTAVQFWAQEPSPKSAHRKVPVSSNVRLHQRHAYNPPVTPRRSCGTYKDTSCAFDVSIGKFPFHALSLYFRPFELIVKLHSGRCLTTRSTGHFAACQVWAKIRAQT